MFPKQKFILMIVTFGFLAIACGQLEIGVEPTNDDPLSVPPTKTSAGGSIPGEIKQSNEKNQLPSETEDSSPEPTNNEINDPLPEPEEGRLDCRDFGVDQLVSIACNIQDSFISRNTSPLLTYMPPEFALGYWLSEWTTVTPEYALDSFQNYMLPADPSRLTFTTDPNQFPDIGRPIETMLGPDSELSMVIYSEGWGEDGQGAALIFITGNEVSGYQFYALLIAGNHFEMPPTPDPNSN